VKLGTRMLGVLLALAASGLMGAESVLAQIPGLWVRQADSVSTELPVDDALGFAAIPAADLAVLGWTVTQGADTLRLESANALLPEVKVVAGSPFVIVADRLLHLAHAPYLSGGEVFVPVQLVVDFLPREVPNFGFDPSSRTLFMRVASIETAPAVRTPRTGPRVVIIDPGHGGRDPGTTGRAGVREKDVALGLGVALRDLLEADTTIDVYITRDRDLLIPIWRRGEQATEWKGDRPGVFVSLHANALPPSPATRGFETYVLSEARTDHERRVAVAENQAGSTQGPTDGAAAGGLDGILAELRNVGHQPWSLLLAEIIQEELAGIPGTRDRGVKQAPLAVLTNALMPAVLVEIGYLTNRRDEALVRRPDFHADAARAIADAIHRFFDRYPPGETAGR
jgi:N-acetylmuramoyl-L-alanine amidase